MKTLLSVIMLLCVTMTTNTSASWKIDEDWCWDKKGKCCFYSEDLHACVNDSTRDSCNTKADCATFPFEGCFGVAEEYRIYWSTSPTNFPATNYQSFTPVDICGVDRCCADIAQPTDELSFVNVVACNWSSTSGWRCDWEEGRQEIP